LSARVASSPVSFGVFELTVDDAGLPAPATLIRTIAELGYGGTELGPPGYFGAGAEVATMLDVGGLDLVASFIPLRLAHREHHAEDLRELDAALALLDAARGDGPRPMVLLADAADAPDRLAFAGRIEQHPETWLGDERFALLLEHAHAAAARCREQGFPASFHYHAGTYVETPREIERFIDGLDSSLLGIVFDTGHSAFGGGDPLDLLRTHGDLVNHVHLKDVDIALLTRVQAAAGGLVQAWEAGAFCRLGEGAADVAGCVAELQRRAYDGWLVVEQDRVLRPGWRFDDAVAAASANREWLRRRGL
jgi:inosose dehydratase